MFDLGCHPRLCGKGIALTNSIYHPFPDPQLTTCLKICLSLQVYSKKKTVVKQTKVIFIIPGTPPSEVGLLNNNVAPKDEIDIHGSFLTAETEVSKSHDPKDDHLLLTFAATNWFTTEDAMESFINQHNKQITF